MYQLATECITYEVLFSLVLYSALMEQALLFGRKLIVALDSNNCSVTDLDAASLEVLVKEVVSDLSGSATSSAISNTSGWMEHFKIPKTRAVTDPQVYNETSLSIASSCIALVFLTLPN